MGDTMMLLQDDGWTEVRLTRLLRSEDTQQDRPLVADHGGQIRVIVAYGDNDAFSYHGDQNRRGMKLSLFGDAEGEAEDILSDLKRDDFMYQVLLLVW